MGGGIWDKVFLRLMNGVDSIIKVEDFIILCSLITTKILCDYKCNLIRICSKKIKHFL